MKFKDKTEKSRLKLLHQYYKYTGFYKFVWQSTLKAIPLILVFIELVLLLNYFFDLDLIFTYLSDTLPVYGVLAFFFVSETFLGLIPPEMFIAWSGKMNTPWLYLGILAFLSYFGGLLSYHIGFLITKIPFIHNYLEQKMEKQLKNLRKWGGFLIVVGALLPLPFSISCMAAGLIAFPFKNVITFGSLRLLRFVIYGLIIFNVF